RPAHLVPPGPPDLPFPEPPAAAGRAPEPDRELRGLQPGAAAPRRLALRHHAVGERRGGGHLDEPGRLRRAAWQPHAAVVGVAQLAVRDAEGLEGHAGGLLDRRGARRRRHPPGPPTRGRALDRGNDRREARRHARRRPEPLRPRLRQLPSGPGPAHARPPARAGRPEGGGVTRAPERWVGGARAPLARAWGRACPSTCSSRTSTRTAATTRWATGGWSCRRTARSDRGRARSRARPPTSGRPTTRPATSAPATPAPAACGTPTTTARSCSPTTSPPSCRTPRSRRPPTRSSAGAGPSAPAA